jgi:hypothetical protein
MTLKPIATACAALAMALVMSGPGQAQDTTSTATNTPAISTAQVLQFLQLLQGGGSTSSLSSLLGTSGSTSTSSTTGTSSAATAASQPSGPPKNFISNGIQEHQAFLNNSFNLTPVQRRAAMSQPVTPVKIPIALILPTLANMLAKEIPALGFLADLFGKISPVVNPTAPPAKSGEGIVAFLTADDTSLTVGQTTTARLWVQQSSPNSTNDNGIFSVAVSIQASAVGVVHSETPVTVLSTWANSVPAPLTGTAIATGGIDGVAAGVSIPAADKTEGLNGPVEVFDFTVKAVAAGTVTLTPVDFVGGGFTGIIDYKSEAGDETKYVSVTITVK